MTCFGIMFKYFRILSEIQPYKLRAFKRNYGLCQGHSRTKAADSVIYFYNQQRLQTTSSADSVPEEYLGQVSITHKSVKNSDLNIDLNIAFVDTDKDCDGQKPVVLGIHGFLGRAEDFHPLITELDKRGIRFVAPTFPGFEPSGLESWQLPHLDYSTEGREEQLKNILKVLNVHRINMVLCHSGGCWLGYKVAADWDMVKSAGFINPVAARPHKILRPYPIVTGMAAVLRIEMLQKILMPALVLIYKRLGFTGVKSGPHLLATMQTVTSQGFDKVPSHAVKISDKKLPIFLAHSKFDKLVEWDVPREMITQHLSIPEENIVEFSENKTPTRDPLNVYAGDWLARGLLFETGGHLVHKAHSQEIVAQIVDMLDFIRKKTEALK